MTGALMPKLLPDNSTHLELAIDNVAQTATDIVFPNAELFNPLTCPERFLGQLAWALSVDEWDDGWSAPVKRKVCQTAVETHRHKGTRYAIETALNSLDASIDLVEWFENGGQPFTATLTAYASNNLDSQGDTLLTPALQAKLWRVVNAAKNVRTHIDFNVGTSTNTKLHFCAASNGIALQRDAVEQVADYPVQAGLYVCLGGIGLHISRQSMTLA